MSGWTFRAMWPIEDPELSYDDAVNTAALLLDDLARKCGARLVGWAHWSVQETDDLPGWRETPTVVVAEAPAEPITSDAQVHPLHRQRLHQPERRAA